MTPTEQILERLEKTTTEKMVTTLPTKEIKVFHFPSPSRFSLL